MSALEETGAAENTIVIFVSDNGGQSNVAANNGPLRGAKGEMYKGGIRVPMAAVWPGHIAPGSRSGEVALTMDLFPTCCDAAGIPINHAIEGRSLLPALLGEPAKDDERLLFWMRREGGREFGGRCCYAVRRGRWKLVQNRPYEPLQLFDLEADPLEEKPLPRRHPQYREFFEALQAHVNEAGAVPWQRAGR